MILAILPGVGSRHLLPGGILQTSSLQGCRWCCRLSDSSCPIFPVPLVSHLHWRADAACPLKTTSTTVYIIISTPYPFSLSSTQIFKMASQHPASESSFREGTTNVPVRTAPLLMTVGVLTLPLTLLLSISTTFIALDLISNLWNTISPPLNLIFSSYLKHSCL